MIDFPEEWKYVWNTKELLQARKKWYKEFPNKDCTCDHCSDNHICSCAYDGYNTDGDCLLIK